MNEFIIFYIKHINFFLNKSKTYIFRLDFYIISHPQPDFLLENIQIDLISNIHRELIPSLSGPWDKTLFPYSFFKCSCFSDGTPSS